MLTIAFLCLLLAAQAPQATASQPDLTLAAVVDMYFQHNLELEAGRYRVERARADQIAARLRPNPGLSISAENLRLSGPTSFGRLYEVAASYSDTIELGGKRELRLSIADLTTAAAEASFSEAMRQGLAQTKRLYFETLLAGYHLAAAVENRLTFDQLVTINLSRFKEGAVAEADLIKVRLERARFESAVHQSELGLRQMMIRLLDRIGQPITIHRGASGDLERTGGSLDLASLREQALRNRPDIQAAEFELEAAGERVSLEQARNIPDLNPFVGFKRVGSDNTVMAGVTIPLRIRDRNEAGIARAEAGRKIADAQLRQVRNRVLAEVESAYAAYEAAVHELATFRMDLLPPADESRTIALASYREGAADLLEVLETQRTRTAIRQEYYRTLFEYHSSVLLLEAAVGKEIQP